MFQTDLLSSALCDDQQWSALNGDGLVKLYDDTVNELLDQQMPTRCVSCRGRPSNMWYDNDCRSAKRSLRSLLRAARRVGPLSDTTLPAVIAWRTECRRYFDLTRRKRSEYWTTRVDSERLQPRRLWQSFDQLLGRGQAPTVADIDASQLHRFFDDKVAGVRNATAGAPDPQFTVVPVNCELRFFRPVTPTKVIKLVQALPDKQCSSDPAPTWLLKANITVLAPFPCRLFLLVTRSCAIEDEVSLCHADIKESWHGLGRSDILSADLQSLCVVKAVGTTCVPAACGIYFKDNDLLPDRQSAYRAYHSTETAILRVMSDILLALDSGDIAVLTLLDLSAAFDSVDHATLLQRLRTSYGLGGSVLAWFASYLSNRTQCVRLPTTMQVD